MRIETRNRLAWQRFCDRFISGIQDPEFVDLVGPSVTVINTMIFNHLLALLTAKAIVNPDRGIATELRLWSFLWGTQNSDGYLDTLDVDTRLDAMEALAERGCEVAVLGAVDLADQLTRSHGWTELRIQLRNMWRHLLESPELAFTSDVLRLAARPGIRPAAEMAQGLDELAVQSTTPELHGAIADCLHTAAQQIRLTHGIVRRHRRDEVVDILAVDDPEVTLDAAMASTALAVWAGMDQSRDYFRFDQPVPGTIVVWDRDSNECWRFERHLNGDPVMLQVPVVVEPAWAVESRRLLDAARVWLTGLWLESAHLLRIGAWTDV